MAFVYSYEKDGKIEYIGKAKNCRRLMRRLLEHKWNDGLPYSEYTVKYLYFPNEAIADAVETDLINFWNPSRNSAKKGWGTIPLIFIPASLPRIASFELDNNDLNSFYGFNGDPKKWNEETLRWMLLGDEMKLVSQWDNWMLETEMERSEAHG